MAEVTEEYKQSIRKCVVAVIPGTGSEPKEKVNVDWSPVLMGVSEPGHVFLLGWDPRLVPQGGWVDESLQYAPPPLWCQPEPYIQALEAENAALKAQLAKK